MRLGPDPGRWLRGAGLCHGLDCTGLSGVLLEAWLPRPLADDLPVGFKTSNRPAGLKPAGEWSFHGSCAPSPRPRKQTRYSKVGSKLRRPGGAEDTALMTSTRHPLMHSIMVSMKSLRLELLDGDGHTESAATGCVVQDQDGLLLYTCWHVVTAWTSWSPPPLTRPLVEHLLCTRKMFNSGRLALRQSEAANALGSLSITRTVNPHGRRSPMSGIILISMQ
jgi:hypothetical protein